MSVGNIVWTREETSLKVKRVGTLYQVKLLGWTMHTSWKDLVAGNHTAGHVIADVTVKKPDAGIVWDHVDRFHLSGRERDNVSAIAMKINNVAVPVWRVKVV